MNARQIDHWPTSERFEQGRFRMPGADPEQSYRIFFVQPDLHLAALVDLKYDGKPAEVRLQPTASVRGKLVNPDGSPAKNYQTYAMLWMVPEERKLTRQDWFSQDRLVIYQNISQDRREAKPQPDGSFLLENLIPGATMYLVGATHSQLVVRVPLATLKPGEVKDLGELKLAKEEMP
jgi:hypothetical protein